MVKNIIYVRRFCTDNWNSVKFDPFGFMVKDLITGAELQGCDSTHFDLYLIPPSSPWSDSGSDLLSTSYDMWHH